MASSVDEARSLADALNEVAPRLVAAGRFLQDNWHPRLGLVGFSLGAFLVTRHAQAIGAEAAVVYYGIGDIDPGRWEVPLMGHYGAGDEWEPLDEVRSTWGALSAAGAEVDLRVYQGVGHWFANEDVIDAFEPATAALAWGATVNFLKHHLA